MPQPPYRKVPASLKDTAYLVAEATFAFARYTEDPRFRPGDVFPEAIEGTLDLVGQALDTFVQAFEE